MEFLEGLNTENILELIYLYGMRIIFAILVLVIGLWLVKYIVRFLTKGLKKSSADATLISFLNSMFSFVLKALIYITVLTMLGVEMTAFIAVLGAAGLAIGLALQGSLANFAGGVLILLFKPFRVGHYIDGGGESGTVQKIDILHTTLSSFNNQKIIVPNGELANSPIVNYSEMETRRAVFEVGISYTSDIKKAREVILRVLENDERLEPVPEPVVVLNELGDSSLNLRVHAWTKTSEFWGFYWDNLENIKEALDEAGIEIPFPQRDVHIFKEGQ